MKKPLSLEQLTLDSFRKHYYYATELKAMAKAAGIVGVSKLRKDELEKHIEHYLSAGETTRSPIRAPLKIRQSTAKDSDKVLTLSTPIVNYTNNKMTKCFITEQAKLQNPDFKKKSGSSYWLNRWREKQIADGKKITYGDLIEHYLLLNTDSHQNPQIPSTKFNNFISDYLNNEPNGQRAEALAAWETLKQLPIEKTYLAWKQHKK